MSGLGFRRLFCVVLMVWSLGTSASANEWRVASGEWRVKADDSLVTRHSPLATHQAVVLADIGSIIDSFVCGGGRTRIVQVCVVAMCIALFIMMRKLIG